MLTITTTPRGSWYEARSNTIPAYTAHEQTREAAFNAVLRQLLTK